MMKLGFLFLFLTLMGAGELFAADFRRTVDLEWEPVDGSPYYEIEVSKHLGGGKKKDPQIFKVPKAAWNGKLKPGQYEMRLRSFDSRYVPGDWSEPSAFWVKLPAPVQTAPAMDFEYKAPDADETDVDFAWEAVNGADKYKIEIKAIRSPWTKTKVVKDTKTSISVPVAEAFLWRVSALLPDDEEGDAGENWRKFTIVGKSLETPKIAVPSTEFVRELTWDKSEFADKYEFKILHQGEGGWKQVEEGVTKKSEVKFKQKYKGGQYRLVVKALAPARAPSQESVIEFNVYNGDRSPAAVKEAQMREAIEKPTNWYSIFSYFLTKINYVGVNKEVGQQSKYDAVGGTGRIGIGYVLPKSNWGFFGIADMSGFVIGTQNFTFASGELHGVWRTYLGTRTQLRATGGLFYKELPETIPQGSNTYSMSKVSGIGPHIGFDLWQPVSMKLGLQLNARVYYNAVGASIPNGQAYVPNVSYQAGLLGSLKLSRDVTGFAGYAYRLDNMGYNARVDRSSTNPSNANAGDINTVSITGHYMNFLLELGF